MKVASFVVLASAYPGWLAHEQQAQISQIMTAFGLKLKIGSAAAGSAGKYSVPELMSGSSVFSDEQDPNGLPHYTSRMLRPAPGNEANLQILVDGGELTPLHLETFAPAVPQDDAIDTNLLTYARVEDKDTSVSNASFQAWSELLTVEFGKQNDDHIMSLIKAELKIYTSKLKQYTNYISAIINLLKEDDTRVMSDSLGHNKAVLKHKYMHMLRAANAITSFFDVSEVESFKFLNDQKPHTINHFDFKSSTPTSPKLKHEIQLRDKSSLKEKLEGLINEHSPNYQFRKEYQHVVTVCEKVVAQTSGAEQRVEGEQTKQMPPSFFVDVTTKDEIVAFDSTSSTIWRMAQRNLFGKDKYHHVIQLSASHKKDLDGLMLTKGLDNQFRNLPAYKNLVKHLVNQDYYRDDGTKGEKDQLPNEMSVPYAVKQDFDKFFSSYEKTSRWAARKSEQHLHEVKIDGIAALDSSILESPDFALHYRDLVECLVQEGFLSKNQERVGEEAEAFHYKINGEKSFPTSNVLQVSKKCKTSFDGFNGVREFLYRHSHTVEVDTPALLTLMDPNSENHHKKVDGYDKVATFMTKNNFFDDHGERTAVSLPSTFFIEDQVTLEQFKRFNSVSEQAKRTFRRSARFAEDTWAAHFKFQ